MVSRSGVVLGGLLATSLLGCESALPKAAFSLRDSAGVTIAESAAPRWAGTEPWRVEPVLDLTTSGRGEPHYFYLVMDAVRLRDGGIAVAESGSDEVRFFSPTGEFLGARGRTGEGPGEFQELWSLDWTRGDSLVVFDNQLQRITVVPTDGGRYRVLPLRPSGGTFVSELHPMNDGTFVARLPPLWVPKPKDGLYRDPEPLVRLDSQGTIVDTLTILAGFEDFQWLARGLSGVPLFGKDSDYAVFGDRVYTGDADEMEVRVLAPSGELERIIRVPDLDLTLRADEIREEREALLGPDPSSRRRDWVAVLPDPDSRPAYRSLVVDTEGYVWAEEGLGGMTRMTNGKPWKWNVFSPEGEWLGAVSLPNRFVVFEIGPDHVLGKRTDDLDVTHVELLDLTRR